VRLAATALFAALMVGGLGLVFSSWALERPLVVWPALAATMLICGALIGALLQGKRRSRDGAVAVFVSALLMQAVALERHAQGGPISLCLIGQLVLVAFAVSLLYGRWARGWFTCAAGTVPAVGQRAQRARALSGRRVLNRTVGQSTIVCETEKARISAAPVGREKGRRQASG
jgi:hypothetical protein